MVRVEHAWNVKPSEAIRIQKRLAHRVIPSGTVPNLKYVIGVDVAFRHDPEEALAVAVAFEHPKGDICEKTVARTRVTFPYIPGLLSFREGPAILKALSQLESDPDLIFFDGQGIAHPRRLGIASHIGVLLDIPTIGCAKSKLCGTYDEPAQREGAASPLIDREETLGMVLRTKRNTAPVFISVGHRIGLEEAVTVVRHYTDGYRIPQPTRVADRLTKLAKSETSNDLSRLRN